MAKYIKPDVSKVWAEGGVTTPPLSSKISLGWVAERPPHEYANFVENRQDTYLRYVNQLGIPEWDATTEYQINQSYVQSPTTGIVYRAVSTNTNKNPDADLVNAFWIIAFDIYGAAAAVQANLDVLNGKYPNLTGINPATSRTNLSVYSKAEIDSMVSAVAIPIGMVTMFPSLAIPPKWVECDGRALSRTGAYLPLFNVCGISYGVGDGVTTFNIPDFRGIFPRGLDHGRGIDASRTLGSYQSDAFQNVVGTVFKLFKTSGRGMVESDAASGPFVEEGESGGSSWFSADASNNSNRKVKFDASRVARTSTETRPANQSIVFCMYTGV